MKLLVVNADDFGRSSPVNLGILEAHTQGIVTSVSLMVTREGFAEAVAMAQDHPALGVGLHLDLDRFFDVQHGSGRLLRYKENDVPLQAVAEETEDQLRKARAAGFSLTHVDSHHHAHLRPELFAAVAALAAKFRVPVIRYFRGFYEGSYRGLEVGWTEDLLKRLGLRTVDTFFAGWEPVESSLPGYRYFDPECSFQTAELMVHPGKGEAWREAELARCLDPKIRRILADRQIQLGTFAGLS